MDSAELIEFKFVLKFTFLGTLIIRTRPPQFGADWCGSLRIPPCLRFDKLTPYQGLPQQRAPALDFTPFSSSPGVY